ncbi:glucose dehydrogenase [FAD, quinone]-like [Zophobas morio]|uniref:glucose dehydrogenase [FAD, quinone]-like n=1 Tax=Zophobas morio TaxID=2755281 RepID=UPI003083334B
MFLLLYITLFFVRVVTPSLTTDYYQTLISERTTQAQVYELPQTNSEFATSHETTDFGSYDFIIAGAGSAGSVLASRLSEIDDWRILLLEAGGEEDDFNAIPGMFPYLQFSEMNWGYYTTPQANCCLGMRDNKCMAPRGKSIGGSSAINAVLYVRGNAEDYDKWAQLGNPGWSYEEVLPYFMKSENSQIGGNGDYHGKGGFWGVEHATPYSDLFDVFVEANDALNQSNIDYNGAGQIGVSKTQLSIKHGKRQSAGTAFLDNARKRSNLEVVTGALVTRVNINEETKRAEGVEFATKEQKFRVSATKEVLVAAGAINTPQLLMLSGIGPSKHLEELGIDVIADLPVGQNLMEHPQFLGLTFHTNYSAQGSNLDDSIEQYLQGSGPLTSTAEALGFLHGSSIDGTPTIMYAFSPPSGSSSPIVARMYNYNDDLIENYLNKLNPSSDVSFSLILLHQKSRGSVTLKSSDPIDFPNVDLNMFEEEEDVDDFVKGIDFVLDLVQTEPFQRINATFVDIPVCGEFEKFSREFWGCAVRHMSMTLYHPCGTTAMGLSEENSVVDSSLKVHGIASLRVVDAGIFPSTISGPTNAAVIMVAEKIADVIKNEYGFK